MSGGGATTAGAAGMSAAGAAGAPPMAPPCDQIPSLAKGDGSFTVSSPAFASCMPIPAEHTCDQKPFPQGTSFAFSWTAGPSGTQSYAVVFKDLAVIARTSPTDSNYNKGFHWVMWDIPTTTTMLPASMKPGHLYPDIPGARQWSNFNDYAFFGPCPNFDPATAAIYDDTYAIVVYALPFGKSSISPPTPGVSTVRQFDDYFKGAALAVAEYRGTSNAHASEIPDGVLPPMTQPPCATTCQLATACLMAP